MSQFIGYVIDGTDADRSTPVATGATREACMGLTAQRALLLQALHDEIGVQQRDDVPPEDFASLTTKLDEWFAERGLVVR